MKLEWPSASINPEAVLSKENIFDLKFKILRAQHYQSNYNCFNLATTPKEVEWMKANLTNCCVKTTEDGVNDENVKEGLCLTFIGIDEYTVDQAIGEI